MADENKRETSRVVYMTEDEFAEIAQAAQSEDRPVSAFFRAAALDRARRILNDRPTPAAPVADVMNRAA
jgi:uncharacterized protein (DUF1778 family)